MINSFSSFIGLRYAKAKRKNHFISFISLVSLIGIALGVAVLITVLSVMNGFGVEIRKQILSASPHISLKSYSSLLYNSQELISKLTTNNNIIGVAPFVIGQGLIKSKTRSNGTFIRGIDISQLNNVYPLESNMLAGNLNDLQANKYSLILSKVMAESLMIKVGDKVTLFIPELRITPAGIMPRLKQFTVIGIYSAGMMYDHNVFINIKDASTILKLKNAISGIQMKVKDDLQARVIAEQLDRELEYKYSITDWTRENQALFEALKMEKTVMWLILFLIVAVAAFNLISTLVMMVTDKQVDIGVMRVIGATRADIIKIFMIQGSLIGFIGTFVGLLLGLLLASNVTMLVSKIQEIFQVEFISSQIYYISYVPSHIELQDVVVICVSALLLSFIATIYPAWRASQIQPAEALRYE